jgi:limonene 1,2-monooxygenase
VGPGALVTDAIMLGIEPTRQRPMMDEALAIIMRLFTDPTPLTYESDWFRLKDATLQLRPYTQPHPPLAVASMESPSGPLAAGRYGAAILSLAVTGGQRGKVDLKKMWAIAEEEAARHGKTMNRADWRLVVPVHVAPTRQQALDDVRVGAANQAFEYGEAALGRKVTFEGPREKLVEHMVESGSWIVGTPDDLVAAIHRFDRDTDGFGGLLLNAHEWASQEATLKSYELIARYVMPRFQGSLVSIEDSYRRSVEHSTEISMKRTAALEGAHQRFEQRTPTPA